MAFTLPPSGEAGEDRYTPLADGFCRQSRLSRALAEARQEN